LNAGASAAKVTWGAAKRIAMKAVSFMELPWGSGFVWPVPGAPSIGATASFESPARTFAGGVTKYTRQRSV
jgi:hypothetical protein